MCADAVPWLTTGELPRARFTPGPVPHLDVTFLDAELWQRSARWANGSLQLVLADAFGSTPSETVSVDVTLLSGERLSLNDRVTHRGRERMTLEVRRPPARIATVLDRACGEPSGSSSG